MRKKRGTGVNPAEHEPPDPALEHSLQLHNALNISVPGFHFNFGEEAELLRRIFADEGLEGDLCALRPEIQKAYGKNSLPDLGARLVGLVDRIRSIHRRLESGNAEADDLGALISYSAECGFIVRETWEEWARLPALAQFGLGFKHEDKSGAERTKKATLAKILRGATHEEGVISFCEMVLRNDMGRKNNGKPNASELARLYMSAGGRNIGEDRVRHIIGEAIREKKLA